MKRMKFFGWTTQLQQHTEFKSRKGLSTKKFVTTNIVSSHSQQMVYNITYSKLKQQLMINTVFLLSKVELCQIFFM